MHSGRPACEAPRVHWELVVVAVILLGFAAISRRIEGTPITAPLVFTAAGLVVGVEALDLAALRRTAGSGRAARRRSWSRSYCSRRRRFPAPLANSHSGWHDARIHETLVESRAEEELRWRLQHEEPRS